MKLHTVDWLVEIGAARSRARAYQLVAEGLIPSIRLGRAIRLDEVEVLEALRRHAKPERVPADVAH